MCSVIVILSNKTIVKECFSKVEAEIYAEIIITIFPHALVTIGGLNEPA